MKHTAEAAFIELGRELEPASMAEVQIDERGIVCVNVFGEAAVITIDVQTFELEGGGEHFAKGRIVFEEKHTTGRVDGPHPRPSTIRYAGGGREIEDEARACARRGRLELDGCAHCAEPLGDSRKPESAAALFADQSWTAGEEPRALLGRDARTVIADLQRDSPIALPRSERDTIASSERLERVLK